MQRPMIYLDHAATTPVRPEARAAMLPFLDERFGNPSSSHRAGRDARAALEQARERLAGAVGAARDDVVFTSGGTEADNLAVLGRWRAQRRPLVVSAIEHKAVLTAAQQAAREGAPLIVLAVDEDGVVDLDALDEALAAQPALVSVMWVNNELGTVQPVADIARRCRGAGVPFHSDAVQAVARVPVRLGDDAPELLTVSGHKIGAPKGIGALVVGGAALEPLVHGGGQERALRPGTQNVAGAVALAVAVELALAEREAEAARLGALRDTLEATLREHVPGLRVNAAAAARAPHILNVTIPDVDADALLAALDLEGLAVSTGSACQSGSAEESHVLTAIGAAGRPGTTLRLSLGNTTTAEDVDAAARVLPRVVERVRELAVPA